MTVDRIADYCEFTNATVSAGSPETGFVEIDGTGLTSSFNAYRRFLAHRELAGLAEADEVIAGATVFRIQREESRQLSREEFEAELARFEALVGS